MQKVKIALVAGLACSAAFIGGCASVSVHPVSVADANNPSISGIRFYQSAPYLLVTEMPTPMHAMIPHPRPGMPAAGRGMAMRGGPWNRHGGPMGRMHGMEGMHRQRHADNHHPQRHPMMGGRHGPQRRPGMMVRRPMMPMPMMRPQRMMLLQIIYLPDFSKPYVANFNNPFSHGKNSIVLANGWELMGINVKGHIKEPPPIRAVTAVPTRPGMPMRPMMGPMMGQMGMRPGGIGPMRGMGGMMRGGFPAGGMGWNGGHKPKAGGRMMPRPGMRLNRLRGMMILRRAALGMGLSPGLYQFVYSPKTGQLLGLRRVRILPGMMLWGPHMMFHGRWAHRGTWKHPKNWKMHPSPQQKKAPATQS